MTTASALIIETTDGRTSLFTGRVTIGQAGDFPVDDTHASTLHAVLWPGETGWLVSDLGSMNGTFLNGEKIYGPRWLSKGDTLRIGHTEITVVPA